MEYGYIRVSTRDQNEARQVVALCQCGLVLSQLFIDKQSGKDFNRPQYRRLIRRIKKGDVLYIKSIDRLGRNYTEILEQWRLLTRDKGVKMRVLDMPLLNTRDNDDLTGKFISDIVLQLLSYVAETERSFIKQRQAEGIAIAKKQGKTFGRPKKQMDKAFCESLKAWESGQMTIKQAAFNCGMTLSNFRYHLRRMSHADD